MEKRKPERRDRTAAPRPAAMPPAIRHRTATRPFRAEKMQLRRSKCTTYDDIAFNLPIVAFTLSGDPLFTGSRIIPDSRINETRSFSTPGPLKVRSERTQMIRGFPIGSSWPFVSARRSSIHKSICGNDTTMTRKFKIFFN